MIHMLAAQFISGDPTFQFSYQLQLNRVQITCRNTVFV